MVKKNFNNSSFANSLATAQKNKAQCTAKYQKGTSILQCNTPYPMIVTNITENAKGYVFETDIFVEGTVIKKSFFFSKNPDVPFLDDFVETVNPNATKMSDLIGIPFDGELTKSGVYTNMSALGVLNDEEDEEEY